MNFRNTASRGIRLHAHLIIGFVLVIAYLLISMLANNQLSREKQTERFQKNIGKYALELEQKGEEVMSILNNNPAQFWPLFERSVNPEEIILQIYLRDSLLYWNSQKISNDILDYNLSKTDTVIQESTGWYLLHQLRRESFTFCLLKQLKSQYEFDNSYLPVFVDDGLGISQDVEFTTDYPNAQFVIKDKSGESCIGLNFTESEPVYSKFYTIILFLIYLAIYLDIILIISKLYDILLAKRKNWTLAFLFFCTDLIIIRLLDIYLHIPGAVKHSFIFSSQAHSITGLTTMGDLIVNSMLLLAIAVKIFSQSIHLENAIHFSKRNFIFLLIFLLGVISFFVHLGVYETIDSLGYHSFLGIQINNIPAIASVLIILLLNTGLFLWVLTIQNLFRINRPPFYLVALILLLTTGLLYLGFSQDVFTVLVSFSLTLAVFLVIYFPSKKQDIRLIKFISLAILFAVSSALIINNAEKNDRDLNQAQMAKLFSNPDDPNLKSDYTNAYQQLLSDYRVAEILANSDDPDIDIENYIIVSYFSAYRHKYDIQVTVCEEGEQIEVQPEGTIFNCDWFFDDIIAHAKSGQSDSSLYVLEDEPGRIVFMGRVILNDTTLFSSQVNIYLEFLYTHVPEGLGYPELLVDNKGEELDLTGFSYAIYDNNQLIYKFGNFAYYTNYDYIEEYPVNSFFNLMGYRHYKIEFEANHFILLSRPLARISEKLVTFSGLFLCYVAITFLTFFFIISGKKRREFGISFRNRLQILFVTTISMVIALLAIITLFYVETNNEAKIFEQLNEKNYSVIIELDHKLSGAYSFNEFDPAYLHDMLRKFSLVFFSDINLYDASGRLVASSRPEIFDRGLLSENINPMAFEELAVKHKLNFITRENIGNATYYSSYAPFYLDGNRPAGIVNLPYFALQTEVRKAYYLMFYTFINLFVIFGIIGAFLALLVSRVLAKPLFLLQQNLGNLQIDKENEKIEWNRDDEIGQLIAEYNRMIDKLEQSAELLKHSERESTWREMAQQIAHEIKNPLTPMKLNVQYLEKAYNARDPELDAKMKSISASLITQIDTLDKVAEMFSDFAKSNAGNFEKVDVLKVINSSVSLFKSHSDIEFLVTKEDEAGLTYYTPAVEKDILRVFNNLLKNAIQALENNGVGKIEISLFQKSNQFEVRVKDNGKGIPDEARANIFQPYFTTKTTGTGLGLAIVRNIMHEIGGEITFEAAETTGTVFVLTFKVYETQL